MPQPPTAAPKYGTSAPHFAFRIYDAFAPPDAPELVGWRLMDLADLANMWHWVQREYEQNHGLRLLAPWNATNCCLTLRGGARLQLLRTHRASQSAPRSAPRAAFLSPATFAGQRCAGGLRQSMRCPRWMS